MLGPRKQFDPELNDWAKAAERFLLHYFRRAGYEVVHHPHGKYGKDLECKSSREQFFVEVERRSFRTWKDGMFPYLSVNVPERRDMSRDTILFIVRYDMVEALAVFAEDILQAPKVPHANRYVKGELFYQVPRKRCCPIVLNSELPKSVAELNRENILSHWKTPSKGLIVRREALGNFPPYGMHVDEWRELLVETERELEDFLNLR